MWRGWCEDVSGPRKVGADRYPGPQPRGWVQPERSSKERDEGGEPLTEPE